MVKHVQRELAEPIELDIPGCAAFGDQFSAEFDGPETVFPVPLGTHIGCVAFQFERLELLLQYL